MKIKFYAARGSQKTSPITKYFIKRFTINNEMAKPEMHPNPPNVDTGVQPAKPKKINITMNIN